MPTNKRLASSVSGLQVLLVEDEHLVALLLEDMLAELGHIVVGPIARLNKAVEMAQRATLDVAILDVNINGQDTYSVAEALAREEFPMSLLPDTTRRACVSRIARDRSCRSRFCNVICKGCSPRLACR